MGAVAPNLSLLSIPLPIPFTLPQEWKTKAGRKCLKQHSWFFAGLVTLADWMGSDESQFP
ncbi:HD domain-containing protein, partial [Salmonella enterica subsp. enterica serovar Kentucky]|nr:HD domain-containing protein [Salmonella enterica subsp. enterica serovar Kentucky]